MTIYNLGSINIDHVYRVPHLPAAGETLSASELVTGLGGKGANQAVAAARAGAQVHLLGAIGTDGRWTIDRLTMAGVDTTEVMVTDTPTGHAIINVDEAGENSIVIFPGANDRITTHYVEAGLAGATAGDILLLQNETSEQVSAAQIGAELGMRVVYSAAPFSVQAVRAVLPQLSMLLMNEIEAAQLEAALGHGLADLGVADIVVTRGAKGAFWMSGGELVVDLPALPANVRDTTGAGDCFAGYLAAGLDEGLEREAAMQLALAAASIQVGRIGAGDAMPSRAEVEEVLASVATST